MTKPLSAAVLRWWQGSDRSGITDRWQRLAALQAAGMSQRAISAHEKISQQQVCRILKKHRQWVSRFGADGAGMSA